MISKTIGFRGTLFSDTPKWHLPFLDESWKARTDIDFVAPSSWISAQTQIRSKNQLVLLTSSDNYSILMTGWWFQTFFIFHNIWLKHVKTTNQMNLYHF
jgi:hypothetical protein